MSGRLKSIRVLSDGRPGHENQSIGLAEALARRTGASVEIVRWASGTGLLKRMQLARAGENVDLLIGAGHGTHLPLIAGGGHFQAKTVVIMKPSLPTWFFDLCLVPRHDLANPNDKGHVITTRGALNRLPETPAVKSATGLIMVGGPSKHHGWDGERLPAMMAEIVRSQPDLSWTIGDSRRTPEGFVGKLSVPGASVVPNQQTESGWLPKIMSAAQEVWVTEDSVSMVFEALTAGARVGILPMPVKNPHGRTVRAIHDLLANGYVRTFSHWQANPPAWSEAPSHFHETGRCADRIIQRFFA